MSDGSGGAGGGAEQPSVLPPPPPPAAAGASEQDHPGGKPWALDPEANLPDWLRPLPDDRTDGNHERALAVYRMITLCDMLRGASRQQYALLDAGVVSSSVAIGSDGGVTWIRPKSST